MKNFSLLPVNLCIYLGMTRFKNVYRHTCVCFTVVVVVVVVLDTLLFMLFCPTKMKQVILFWILCVAVIVLQLYLVQISHYRIALLKEAFCKRIDDFIQNSRFRSYLIFLDNFQKNYKTMCRKFEQFILKI